MKIYDKTVSLLITAALMTALAVGCSDTNSSSKPETSSSEQTTAASSSIFSSLS